MEYAAGILGGMYVDLSVPLNQQTPVYPGDPVISIAPAGVLERDGWNDSTVSINTHVGTHIDAPLHMIAGGKTLDQIPLQQFIGRGVLTPVDTHFDLATVKRSDIRPGDIVLFRTGMSGHYHEPIYFEDYPVMSDEIAAYLVERRVKMVGVDTGSVDSAEDFPIHKLLLTGGVLIIENLTNLDKLTGPFMIYALPIKLALDGAPARVVAETA